MGASSGEECRSERMMTLAPSSMASSTFRHTSLSASPSARPGWAAFAGQRPSTAKERQPGWVPSSLM